MTLGQSVSQPQGRGRLWHGLGWLLVAAAFAAVLVAGADAARLYADHGAAALAFPHTLNYGEGPLLDQTMRLVRGAPLYAPDLQAPLLTITNYPPVYLLLQAPFVAANGPALTVGRAVSLVAGALAALMLAALVYTLMRDGLAAVAAGLSLIAMPYLFSWAALARVDALALALSLAGLVVVANGRGGPASLAGAIGLLTAAAYTRQTYALAAPLAACCWLWARYGWWRAAAFAVSLGSVVLAVFCAALVATQGGFFTHLITANANALDPALIAVYAEEMTRHLPLFLAGGGLALTFGLWVSRPGILLAAPYALGGLASAMTIAKIGSDVNYLLELCAGLALLCALLIAGLRRWPAVRAAALAALALQLTWAADLSRVKYDPLLRERIVKAEHTAAVAAWLATHEGVVLADEQMAEVVLSGRAIAFQPFEFSQLARDGAWDEAGFVAALENGVYPYIMVYQPYRNPRLRFERWTPAMLRAINDHFRPEAQFGETTIYRYVGP